MGIRNTRDQRRLRTGKLPEDAKYWLTGLSLPGERGGKFRNYRRVCKGKKLPGPERGCADSGQSSKTDKKNLGGGGRKGQVDWDRSLIDGRGQFI